MPHQDNLEETSDQPSSVMAHNQKDLHTSFEDVEIAPVQNDLVMSHKQNLDIGSPTNDLKVAHTQNRLAMSPIRENLVANELKINLKTMPDKEDLNMIPKEVCFYVGIDNICH